MSIPDPFLHKSGFFTRVDIPKNSTLVYDPNCTDPRVILLHTVWECCPISILQTQTLPRILSPFNVDPVTGQITLLKRLIMKSANLVNSTAILSGTSWWADSTDSQVKAGFHLELNATDNGSPILTSSHKILVVITDENEPVIFSHPPVIP